MQYARISRALIILAFLLSVAGLSLTIWRYGLAQALDQVSLRAASDLELASDRLSTQLQRYQELAVLMADHPVLTALETPVARSAASALLLEAADKTAALDVIYADTQGRVRAAAHGIMGSDLSATPQFQRALQGALGSGHGLVGPLSERAYVYAAPSFSPSGAVTGALIVAVDVEDVEQTWRGSNPAVFFTDVRGEVFISNRSELLGWQRPPGEPGLIPQGDVTAPFAARYVGPHEIWQIGWGPYLPERALHMVRDLPVIGLTGEVLVDIDPARRLAALQAAVVAAVCLAFGALLILATERRRALARANTVLESRVEARTQALRDTNTQLRREISERQEAEAALKQAQADLVQAGKLSALGQMSAGISHELNQPLMAIQSFADNGTQFLKKGDVTAASDNLGRIAGLAHRMGRIIRNLRAFARQEAEAVARVDIIAVLESAFELTQARMSHDDIAFEWNAPKGPLWVKGGEVRLGQVFVNLINNAADAMVESPERAVRVDVRNQGDSVIIDVTDTGPGIAAPEKIFEPFYSTKEVGASEGMGLGLSISYGLVQSFGGAIRGRNRDDAQGAIFTVELARWVEDALEAAE